MPHDPQQITAAIAAGGALSIRAALAGERDTSWDADTTLAEVLEGTRS